MLPLLLALGCLGAVALPAPGMFVAMGLGIAGFGLGLRGARRTGAARLTHALAAALALVGTLLAVARYAVTLVALDRLVAMLG